jgi:hypothetical protein
VWIVKFFPIFVWKNIFFLRLTRKWKSNKKVNWWLDPPARLLASLAVCSPPELGIFCRSGVLIMCNINGQIVIKNREFRRFFSLNLSKKCCFSFDSKKFPKNCKTLERSKRKKISPKSHKALNILKFRSNNSSQEMCPIVLSTKNW